MPHRGAYPKGKGKIKKVMGEFKRGSLRSSSGKKVTGHKQATAIALSEQRRYGRKLKKMTREAGY